MSLKNGRFCDLCDLWKMDKSLPVHALYNNLSHRLSSKILDFVQKSCNLSNPPASRNCCFPISEKLISRQFHEIFFSESRFLSFLHRTLLCTNWKAISWWFDECLFANISEICLVSDQHKILLHYWHNFSAAFCTPNSKNVFSMQFHNIGAAVL